MVVAGVAAVCRGCLLLMVMVVVVAVQLPKMPLHVFTCIKGNSSSTFTKFDELANNSICCLFYRTSDFVSGVIQFVCSRSKLSRAPNNCAVRSQTLVKIKSIQNQQTNLFPNRWSMFSYLMEWMKIDGIVADETVIHRPRRRNCIVLIEFVLFFVFFFSQLFLLRVVLCEALFWATAEDVYVSICVCIRGNL